MHPCDSQRIADRLSLELRCRLVETLPQAFPMIGDSLGHVFQIQAKFLGLHHQLFEFRSQQTSAFSGGGRGRRGHYSADAWQDFQHPFSHQLRDHFMRGVGVDLQLLAQCTD